MEAATQQAIAGWLQAIGALLAIGVTFLLTKREGVRARAELIEQRAHERSLEAERKRAVGQAIILNIEIAIRIMESMKIRNDGGPEIAPHLGPVSERELAYVEALLSRLPPEAMGDIVSVNILADAIGCVMHAHAVIDMQMGLIKKDSDKAAVAGLLRDHSTILAETVADLTRCRDRMMDLVFGPS